MNQSSTNPLQGGQPEASGDQDSLPPLAAPPKPTYSKRGKITIVACVNCRRRKTKCDGLRPVCGQCHARDGQCHFDMNEEQRRLTYLRENVVHLHEEKNSLESLIWNLRISTEEEAIEILRRLRRGTDPQTLAQNVQAGRTLAGVSGPRPEASNPIGIIVRPEAHEQLVIAIGHATPGELDEIVRRLRIKENADSILTALYKGSLLQTLETSGIYSNQEQTFGLTRAGPRQASENESSERDIASAHQPLTLQGSPSTSWTNVTSDRDVISHSLALYFSWQHCFFQSFPQRLFLQDMAEGRTKYCSRLLVNAICASGCLLAPWPNMPEGAQRPLDLSKAFFEESMRELALVEIPSIPTVAALYNMSHVEGNSGRMHRAWDFCGRSVRMALDLNLHLRDDRQTTTGEEKTGRNHAFWGCFIADQLVSFTLGRIPQIPTTAITADLPQISDKDDETPWEPFGDGAKTRRQGARSTTFYEVATLSKILNSTLLLFFAPSQNLKGSLLLDEYNKYKTWYARLSPIVTLEEDSPPHVLSLHMYYHAAVLLLFRPFLKARFTDSEVSPSDVCRTSAAAISQIFDQHRRLYDSVGIYTLQIHCLLTACTIHIINIPAIASTQYLTSACNHFHQIEQGWASGSLNIIKDLVQKWNIVLPMEAEQALYQQSFHTPNDPSYSAKRGNDFLAPPSPALQKKPRLAALPRVLARDSSSTSDGEFNPNRRGSVTSIASSGGKLAALDPTITPVVPANYLFAPFPNQPAPLLGPIHTSAAAGPGVDFRTLNGFDGLSFEGESGWFDPFMGYEILGSYGDGVTRQ